MRTPAGALDSSNDQLITATIVHHSPMVSTRAPHTTDLTPVLVSSAASALIGVLVGGLLVAVVAVAAVPRCTPLAAAPPLPAIAHGVAAIGVLACWSDTDTDLLVRRTIQILADLPGLRLRPQTRSR